MVVGFVEGEVEVGVDDFAEVAVALEFVVEPGTFGVFEIAGGDGKGADDVAGAGGGDASTNGAPGDPHGRCQR